MSLLNDKQIAERSRKDRLLFPYLDYAVNYLEGHTTLSHGASSASYDIRLAKHDFRIASAIQHPESVIDPLDFDPVIFERQMCQTNKKGHKYFVLPPHGYALGVTVEKFDLPDTILGECIGKSTYARCGLIINTTPLEPGWRGYLTLEMYNAMPRPMIIYAEQGIAAVKFYEIATPAASYEAKDGKYQDQIAEVTLPC